jgi:tetratricopeptide (TPR) repeat protein
VAIGEIFISHTHADAGIADALSEAVAMLFGDLVGTSYSTKKELEGGIRPGEDWFRWIVDRVKEADVAVILLTPASVQKPWVLWEAGAVYGAGVASAAADARKVRPLTYRLVANQVPSPFGGVQAASGDDRAGIERFLLDLISTFETRLQSRQVLRAGQMLGRTVEVYLGKITAVLRDAPLIPSEASVQEWCDRLDKLAGERRQSEIEHLHDWLNLTFGRSRDEMSLPIDPRLHRRLGEAYRAADRPDRAAEQFSLALEFAPRDIFILRSLGLAYLDSGQRPQASAVVERIAVLDQDAFSHNVECATLMARLQREAGDLQGAANTYRRALDRNPNSYYLADVLAQTLLRLDRRQEAREVYEQADSIIGRLAERNIWTFATQAAAALVRGDEPSALDHLASIGRLGPNPDDVERIAGGLERIREALGIDATASGRWRAVLSGAVTHDAGRSVLPGHRPEP